MQLVDSHCHIDLLHEKFEEPLEQLMQNALDNQVKYFLVVCINLSDYQSMLEVTQRFDNTFVSIGLHPNSEVTHEPTIADLIAELEEPRLVAIGETGLDYFRSQGELEWQRERFRTHIRAAKQVNLPLIIHSRNAREDTITIMKQEAANECGGVMHCFTEDWAMAQQALDLDFYISFSGIVTFKNAPSVQEVAQKMPFDRMLIETDCPYLAPTPFRGKPNQPAYVKHVAEFIAELRGVTVAEVAERTTENFFRLFAKAQDSVHG